LNFLQLISINLSYNINFVQILCKLNLPRENGLVALVDAQESLEHACQPDFQALILHI